MCKSDAVTTDSHTRTIEIVSTQVFTVGDKDKTVLKNVSGTPKRVWPERMAVVSPF